MKKIALILFDYNLANSHSLINSATILAREGYEVHIFIDSLFYGLFNADFADDMVRVHPIDIQADPRVDYITNKATSERLRDFIANTLAALGDRTIQPSGSIDRKYIVETHFDGREAATG